MMVVTTVDTGSLKEPLSANMPALAAAAATTEASATSVSSGNLNLETAQQQQVLSNTLSSTSNGGGLCPKASLLCRPNSHPFQDRTLMLDQPVKVGRSVARARPSPTNAIFDCKVLSRNHALLWYETGKFYLQDTKSSNGTFVNNQRLSKGSEESLPREVCSGDILQFGVDVMENSRKVTHGCIIATLKLYLPDGKEAKASPTIMNALGGGGGGMVGGGSGGSGNGYLPAQDLYLLNQYIQEALVREQHLETKLAVLQRLVKQTEAASNEGWKSLIDEDRLLTRVEILESQLSAYSKSMTEDKLREEAQRLMEEKEEYQDIAKNTLKKLVDEKLEAVKKMQELEKQLGASEDELATLRELYERTAKESVGLAAEVSRLSQEIEEARKKETEQQQQQQEASAMILESSQDESSFLNSSADASAAVAAEEQLQAALSQVDQLRKELADTAEQLRLSDEAARGAKAAAEEAEAALKLKEESESEKKESESEKDPLNESLAEAEEKIGQLLKVKEKYAEVSQVKEQLETSLSGLEREVESLSFQSQTATAFALGPLFLLLLAVIIAYMPTFSSVFGTADQV